MRGSMATRATIEARHLFFFQGSSIWELTTSLSQNADSNKNENFYEYGTKKSHGLFRCTTRLAKKKAYYFVFLFPDDFEPPVIKKKKSPKKGTPLSKHASG